MNRDNGREGELGKADLVLENKTEKKKIGNHFALNSSKAKPSSILLKYSSSVTKYWSSES